MLAVWGDFEGRFFLFSSVDQIRDEDEDLRQRLAPERIFL